MSTMYHNINNFNRKILLCSNDITNLNIIPSFFVVGAQKAGTTTLHDWLRQQPDVCLPTIKETHFFSHDDRYSNGLHWYRDQFPRTEDAIIYGEIDPEYMFLSASAHRIRDVNPTAKLIFLLRHPLDRAYSHYLMSVRRGFEALPFQAALEAEQERLASPDAMMALEHYSYLSRGFYTAQINHFVTVLDDSDCLFVKFDDLINPSTDLETYASICRFIGLSSSPTLADRSRKSNQASASRSRLLRDLLYRPSPWRKIIGRLIPSKNLRLRIGIMLDRINQKPLTGQNSYSPHDIPVVIRNRVCEEILAIAPPDWLEIR